MADAKKCDVCRNYYDNGRFEEVDVTLKPVDNGTWIHTRVSLSVDRINGGLDPDVCPQCTLGLLSTLIKQVQKKVEGR